MHYRHPRIGFAFDMPDDWDLDSARMSDEGVTVVLGLGDTRLLLQVGRSQGNASARLHLMKMHLKSLRASHIGPCQAPRFGPSRDIVALSFFIAGDQQRWISVSQDGYDYTISHTDEWQDVAAAVDRLCASFVFPAPAQIAKALSRSAPGRMPDPAAFGATAAYRHKPPGEGSAGAVGGDGPPQPLSLSPARLWQRVSERLRRSRVARTQG
ncbi:hypothetical protein [Bordetella genomosp. 11]|uniref:Uncharacterized protein n=1 Tax=Bordetella genomosp. 11 TaxID=1416808 RepID=A0A261UF09_9BORD|nr:hypothetical protein [Bordetella genomosp. 11]OZI60529.1 hypothetical protein CAL28_14050 [Bordetella genomosp. 11]